MTNLVYHSKLQKWLITSCALLIYVKQHMMFATNDQSEINSFLVLSLTRVNLHTSDPQTYPRCEPLNGIGPMKCCFTLTLMNQIMTLVKLLNASFISCFSFPFFFAYFFHIEIFVLMISIRSALEKKKAEVEKEFGAIDYDAPSEPEQNPIGLGTKV